MNLRLVSGVQRQESGRSKRRVAEHKLRKRFRRGTAAGARPPGGSEIRRSAGDSAGEPRVRQRASLRFRGQVQIHDVRPSRTPDGEPRLLD